MVIYLKDSTFFQKNDISYLSGPNLRSLDMIFIQYIKIYVYLSPLKGAPYRNP